MQDAGRGTCLEGSEGRVDCEWTRRGVGSSYCGSVVTNPTSIQEDASLIPGFAQWVKDPALWSCGVGGRLCSFKKKKKKRGEERRGD